MLEVRNLCKTYRPKHGVPVKAIDRVSLSLPETGMIFLLGKSGSGKSTLLNLLGGLDRYDSGDVLVHGMSTRDFKQVHFDSYRNTYVGFIFQEYNLLDEFTVGANIALAIELQGRRAEDAEINEILREVDLVGYGNRRTNELSGGQKQRVAIARALVKKPKIIMADEPSGALDATTGRAVFETLKRLSAERLVMVVSHDREFAETYGDRIIELADGRVIDDRVLAERSPEEALATLTYTEEGIEIPADYQLTEEDRLAINEYLRARQGGKLSVTAAANARRFVPTKTEEKTEAEQKQSIPTASPDKSFRLIRSRLPLRSAFRIGASALGHKKVRLVFTILLSVVAFVLFGLSDTVASYDHVRTATNSIVDTGVRYASFAKTVKYYDYYSSGYNMTDDELAEVRERTGLPLVAVYNTQTNLSFSMQYNAESEAMKELGMQLRATRFTNFAEITEDSMRQMGYELVAGRIPDGARDEIAISDYVFESFRAGGYASVGSSEYVAIESERDMIGKTLSLGGIDYEITGVYDTRFDFERYDILRKDINELPTADTLTYFIMASELGYEINYGFAGVAYTGEGFLERYMEANPHRPPLRGNLWFGGKTYEESTVSVYPYFDSVIPYAEALPAGTVFFEEGKSTLAPGEVVVPLYAIEIWDNEGEENYTADKIIEYLKTDPTITAQYWEEDGKMPTERDFRVVGYVPIPEGEMTEAEKRDSNLLYCAEEDFDFLTDDHGLYAYAVAPMPTSRAQVEQLVRLSIEADKDYRYELQNGVSYELSIISELLAVLGDVFLWIGIFFAIFASLLFSNFIGTSVAYKKQEIGILRAIGSRSNDVFRIFFSEAFIIAMISFAISALGTGLAAALINLSLREGTGLLVTILGFGIRQIALILLISVGVAFLASFLPVRRIAAKRPIDAIRDR